MAYTDKDAIYEIAEKLGYQGDEGLTTTEAVYAVAAALGYTGEHDKSVALALSDLKTVVGGGGGGGDLGAGFEMVAFNDSNQPLGCNVYGFDGALYVTKGVEVTPVLPSGTTYLLFGFYDGDGNEFPITSDDQVSAMIIPAGGSPTPYTDFELVDAEGVKRVRFSPAALDAEGTKYAFIITPK